MKVGKLNLTERELRILSIVFVSAMEHDWNDWFDGEIGMTGESKEKCDELYEKLHFIFDFLGEDGLKKYNKLK